MYIELSEIIMCVVLSILGFIGMWIYWKQQNSELYKRCTKAEDELQKYKKKEQEAHYSALMENIKDTNT